MNHLLIKSDFKKRNLLPRWLNVAYDYWSSTVSHNQFPCHFGMKAERDGLLRYTYCENHNFSALPHTLSEFLKLSRKNPSIRYALVLFVEPELNYQHLDYDYYNANFWSILSYLHEQDDKEWSNDIPLDPDDPHWEFVFNGEPIFVSGNAPFYQNRITRNLGDCLIMIFQPRRIFADISYTTPHGRKAIEVIRKKVEKIENMPYHPDLGGYEDLSKREWKQYLITDDYNPTKGTCPMRNTLLSSGKGNQEKEKPC